MFPLLACGVARAQQGLLLYVPNGVGDSVSVFQTTAGGLAPVTTITPFGNSPEQAAVRADQAFAYVTSNLTNEVMVVDTATHTIVQAIGGVTGPRGIAVSPNGQKVYAASNTGGVNTVSAYAADPVTGQLTFQAAIATGANTQPRRLAFSPDGARLYVANQGNLGANGSIAVVDTATNAIVATVATGGQLTDVAVNPAGTRVYATSTTNQVFVVDTSTNAVVATPATGGDARGVAVSPDGTRFYVANQNTNTINQFDAATNTSLGTVAGTGTGITPFGIEMSPGGAFAYVVNNNSSNVSVFTASGGLLTPAGTVATGTSPTYPGICASGDAMLAAGATFVANSVAALGCNGGTPPTFTGGTLRVNAAGLSFTTAMVLGAAGGTVNTNGNDATIGGVLSGTGALAKSGAGTLTLSGASTYGGATTVAAGTLALTGSLASAVTVASGATLTGTGTIAGNTNVGAGATLAPGVSGTGILGTGSLALASGATFGVQLNGTAAGTQYDRVNVTGAVNLGGATLVVTLGFAPAVGTIFTLIDNDAADAVTGTFAGLAEGAIMNVGGVLLAVSYSGGSGNDVTLTAVAVPATPVITSATPGNAQATIAFTTPAANGSPITGYVVTCNPGAISVAGPASPITVTSLSNGTAYACSVAATNAVGTGPSSPTATVTPSFTVYTGPSATGTGTITASFTGGGPGCSYVSPQFIGAPPGAAPVPPTAPGSGTGIIRFPHGLFLFSATGCTPGSTLTFTIVYPTPIGGHTYWKYGPTAVDPTPHWYVQPATIAGSTATFTITDGGLGDDDLVANGTIVDQGGPGIGSVPVPTLSEWTLIVLMLLVGASGAWMGRHRAAR